MKCLKCGKDFQSNFCPDCGYKINTDISSNSTQTHKEVLPDAGKDVLQHYTKKPFSKSFASTLLAFVIIVALVVAIANGCQTQKNKYMTSGDWADLSNYVFAVEIDDFDGDIYEAGNYHFGIAGVAPKPEDTMIVWDIYVSDNLYSKKEELKDYELKATIGGNDKTEANIYLSEGKYVYINYIDVWGNPCGYVTIEKQ